MGYTMKQVLPIKHLFIYSLLLLLFCCGEAVAVFISRGGLKTTLITLRLWMRSWMFPVLFSILLIVTINCEVFLCVSWSCFWLLCQMCLDDSLIQCLFIADTCVWFDKRAWPETSLNHFSLFSCLCLFWSPSTSVLPFKSRVESIVFISSLMNVIQVINRSFLLFFYNKVDIVKLKEHLIHTFGHLFWGQIEEKSNYSSSFHKCVSLNDAC